MKIVCYRSRSSEDRITARVWAEKFLNYLYSEAKNKYPVLHLDGVKAYKVYCVYTNKGNIKGFTLYKMGSNSILGSMDIFGLSHIWYRMKCLESVCLK